jgi:hypothetical protein
VWSVRVVVGHVGLQHTFKVVASEDEDPVEAFAAYGADPAFGVGVGLRGSHRGRDDVDAVGPEDLVEEAGELGVAVADKEAACRHPFTDRHEEVAGLLGDPGAGRVGGHPGKMDAASIEFDQEQHIEAA